jgi:predicted NAD/FAD-binding protein
VNTQVRWRVVRGGSDTYVGGLIRPLGARIHRQARISQVVRCRAGVAMVFEDQPPQRFDAVVFACHGDQVLPMLANPTDAEREVFGAFRTTPNETVLHTDSSMLPQSPHARASWNYRLDGRPDQPPSVTYDLNRLQGISGPTQYCVTLNPRRAFAERSVIGTYRYRHPQFTHESLAAQARWREVSAAHHTHYCGAYWRYGFHEDGLWSAMRVADDLGAAW